LAQKVGRREKLAQKIGRREIYSPVPPPTHYIVSPAMTKGTLVDYPLKVQFMPY